MTKTYSLTVKTTRTGLSEADVDKCIAQYQNTPKLKGRVDYKSLLVNGKSVTSTKEDGYVIVTELTIERDK
jgi:hypothetical protein